jgi:hypothetical protein
LIGREWNNFLKLRKSLVSFLDKRKKLGLGACVDFREHEDPFCASFFSQLIAQPKRQAVLGTRAPHGDVVNVALKGARIGDPNANIDISHGIFDGGIHASVEQTLAKIDSRGVD